MVGGNLNEQIYQECLAHWKGQSRSYFPMLAMKYGYKNPETLRSQFRRERKRRGEFNEWMGDAPQPRFVDDLPKVGVVDIEMLPAIGYHWGMWDQNISVEQLIEDVCFLSWAGKYIHDPRIRSDILTPDEARSRNPQRITMSAHEFISSCDIVVGHNYLDFDGKHLNTYFLMYASPVAHRTIDTLKIARSNFKFSRNTLEFINKKLGIRNKMSHEGFPLWRKCSDGEQESLDTMLSYNQADILATEELFWRFQPFINNLPNFATYHDDDDLRACHCGSYNIKNIGLWFTNSAKYQKLQCEDCGAIMRGKKNLLLKDQRLSLLVRL